MSFKLPEKCLRERTNCNPLSQLLVDGDKSFFCVGIHNGTINNFLQDRYITCFKGEFNNDVSFYDKRDLVYYMHVFAQALAIIEELENKESVKDGEKEI